MQLPKSNVGEVTDTVSPGRLQSLNTFSCVVIFTDCILPGGVEKATQSDV